MISDHISYLEKNINQLLIHTPNNLTWPTIFEYYSAIHLSKLYQKPFYVWKDLSPIQKKNYNFPNTDKGVDITETSFTILGQSKYYSENNTITYGKLATFLSTDKLVGRDDLQFILLRSHHSLIDKFIKPMIDRKTLIDIPLNNNEFLSFCEEIRNKNFEQDDEKEEFTLRPYQEDGKKIIEQDKNGILCIPTGCGKTVIFLDYTRESYSKDKTNKFLILVPTLILLDQWKKEAMKMGFSENIIYTIGSESNNKITKKNFKDNTIFISVYNSFEVIKPYYSYFKKVCIDEAHRIFKPKIYKNDEEDELEEEKKDKYTLLINQSILSNDNSILMSATIDSHEDFLYYEYSIREAINNGYLTDYQLIFPIFTDDPSDKNIAEYIIKKGESHMIIYTSTIPLCNSFVKILNDLLPNSAKSIHSDIINKKERDQIIKDFDNGLIRFLVNVRVLVEGFNSPICSSVLFLHMSSNEVFIKQALGRSLRLYLNKLISNIYFPYNKEGDEKDIYTFIKQLANSDHVLKEELLNKSKGTYLNFEKIINNENEDNKDDIENENSIEEKEVDIIDHRFDLIFNSITMTPKTPLEKAYLTIEYAKKNNKVPPFKEPIIGHFWGDIKQGYNPEIYKNVLSKDDILREDYEKVQKIKEEKKETPQPTPLDKAHLLLEFVNKEEEDEEKGVKKEKRVPTQKEPIIGKFWDNIKQGKNKEIYKNILSKNDILRKDYDKVQKIKEEKEGKKQFTHLEKAYLTIEYAEKNNKVPPKKEPIIGSFWSRIKQDTSKEIYKNILSKNELLKKDYDKVQKIKEEKKK